VKFLSLLLLLATLLLARENPFEPVYNLPKVQEDNIPLLNIKTSQAFQSPTKLIQVQHTTRTLPIISTNIEPQTTKREVVTEKIACQESIPKKCTLTTPKPQEKKRAKKYAKKRKSYQKYRTIFNNYFLKVETNGKHFKIFSKDRVLQKQNFSHPKRVALDFERLQYFHTKSIPLHSNFVKKVRFGSHHEFYRITLELKHRTKTKLTKKPYGYLLTLY
jgi:hypothetical protein